MKILAKFLLSSVFVFLPAVCCAQNDFGLQEDCGFPPALKTHAGIPLFGATARELVDGFDELEYGVNKLEDGQNCLDVNLMRLKTSVESLHTQIGWNADSNLRFRNDIKDLQDKLKQTELDLHTAETKIETLENRLTIAEFYSRIPPHPTNRKAAANKPKAPVNKPTPAAKEGTH
jgi:hypothetical protein